MTTAAVLGTGTMGAGMARSLLREGFDVQVWNRTADKATPLGEDGARVCASAQDAVRGAEAVLVMVFDADAVLEVLQSVSGDLGSDAVVLQCSTIGPAGARRADDLAVERGLRVLDCPVLGTKKPAEEGKLVMLASGDPALRARVQSVLDAVGAKTVWAGERPGAGSALKLACNAWVASITAAAAQSLSLAQALGVDPQLFLDAIDGGASDTPYAHVKGAAMLAGDWTTSFALDGIRKDLDLMRAAAGGVEVTTVLLDALREAYGTASQAGHGADDIAAVYSAFTAASAE